MRQRRKTIILELNTDNHTKFNYHVINFDEITLSIDILLISSLKVKCKNNIC